MGASSSNDVTQMLRNWSKGDKQALDELMPLVYKELRRLASYNLRRERPDHTLEATALVYEAYFRLINQCDVTWRNRAHIFGIAAQLMRRILVDCARNHQAAKRGSRAPRISLEHAVILSRGRPDDLVALDEALTRLAKVDSRQERIVELRFFAGLSEEETARTLEISLATVKREWSMAKAWLQRELYKHDNEAGTVGPN